MFNRFYNSSVDEDMSEWEKMLEGLQIVISSPVVLQMTAQFILDKFLQCSLKLRNEIFLPTSKEAICMEKSEEESLRSIVGYILFIVKRNIKSKLSSEGGFCNQLLWCWGSKEEKDAQVTFLECTKTLVGRVNWGGLLLVYVYERN